MAKKLSFSPTLLHILALIPMGIRLRVFIDLMKNPAFLSPKTILE